jgi:hypothetical protein
VAGTAADAGQAAAATWHAAGTRELAAGAATDTRDAAAAAGTAGGATVRASGAAVAVGVTATAARVVLEDDVSGCRRRHRWSSRKIVGTGDRCRRDRCSDRPSYHQWFHEG